MCSPRCIFGGWMDPRSLAAVEKMGQRTQVFFFRSPAYRGVESSRSRRIGWVDRQSRVRRRIFLKMGWRIFGSSPRRILGGWLDPRSLASVGKMRQRSQVLGPQHTAASNPLSVQWLDAERMKIWERIAIWERIEIWGDADLPEKFGRG